MFYVQASVVGRSGAMDNIRGGGGDYNAVSYPPSRSRGQRTGGKGGLANGLGGDEPTGYRRGGPTGRNGTNRESMGKKK